MVGNKTLIVGADAEPGVVFLVLKSYSSRNVHIIATPREREEAKLLSTILDEQGITSRVWVLHLDATDDVFATASQIICEEQETRVLATGIHQSSLVCAAFVHGAQALSIQNSKIKELPVLPFDYASQLSGAKYAILQAVRDRPALLQEVIKFTKLKPSALSYHLHGAGSKPGLFSMRVVAQDDKKRLTLTPKGKTLIRGLENRK